ncbi:MAG: hypothetical protein H6906_10300 [Hyphomicrobiales bacterium]|nr:hypothetical protein [Hyphomicrobiales bacterium]
MAQSADRVVFRGPTWIWVLYVVMAVLFVALGAFVVALLVPTWTAFDAVFGVVFLMGPILACALLLVVHARRVRRSRMELDDAGLTLVLPDYGGWIYMGRMKTWHYAWPEVSGVTVRRRLYGAGAAGTALTEYLIAAGPDIHVLTRTFIRHPERAAAAIAARAGVEIADGGMQRRLVPSKD